MSFLEKIKNFEYKAALTVSYLAMFVEGATMLLLVAFMYALSTRFGRGVGEIAFLLSVKSFGTLLMLVLSGKISEKYGKKIPVLIGSFLFTVFLLAFLFVQDYRLALLFAFVGGLAHGFMDTPSMSLLFDIFPKNASPAMSLVQLFFSGGAVFMTLTTAYLFKQGIDERTVLWIVCVLNVVLFFLCLFAKFPKKKEKLAEEKLVQNKEKTTFALKFQKEGVLLLLCTLLSASFTCTMSTWLPEYLQKIKLWTPALSLSTLSLYQVGAVIGAFAFSFVLRKVHSLTLLCWDTLIGIVFLGVFLYSTTPFFLRLLVLLMGVFMGLFFSLCIGIGGDLFKDKAEVVTGLVASANMIGNILVTWLSGKWYNDIGIFWIFSQSFFALLLLWVLAFVFKNRADVKAFLQWKGTENGKDKKKSHS